MTPIRIQSAGPTDPSHSIAFGRRRTVRAAFWLALFGLHASSAISAQTPQSSERSHWPPEIRSLLQTYRSGDYDETRRQCASLLTAVSSERLRREINVIQSLTMLRTQDRQTRVQGRTLLARLAAVDPSLERRPECLLAMGVALRGQFETASALDQLDRAVEGFRAIGLNERAADALAELAAAWAAHGEWELTPARFGAGLPSGADAGWAVRLRNVEAIRDRLRSMASAPVPLARVELLLARNLIKHGGREAEGVEILETLAADRVTNDATAEAAEMLAETYEASSRWEDALGLYRRIADARLGSRSEAARRRVREITRSSVSLEVAAAVSSGERVRPIVRARGLRRVKLEVRRVDLVAWLEANQGKLVERKLPDDGAQAVAAREFRAVARDRYGLFTSDKSDVALDFTAPLGSYVVIARGFDAGGREVVDKRLLLVSDLRAAVFTGARNALLWSWALRNAAGSVAAELDDAAAWFWMHTSFVATRPSLRRGVATFRLPPEARVSRNRHWTAVVRAGHHLALCRGELRSNTSKSRSLPAVVLLSDRLIVPAGESLLIRGFLLPEQGGELAALRQQTVWLDVRDASDQLHDSIPTRVSPYGTFEARVPTNRDMAGRTMRVVVRSEGGVLQSVRAQRNFRVDNNAHLTATVDVLTPTWIDSQTETLTGQVRAVYPWGTPLTGAECVLQLDALQLPDPERSRAARPIPRSFYTGRLDHDGRYRFQIPFADLGVDGRFAAFRLHAQITGWDMTTADTTAEILRTPEPLRLRLFRDVPTASVGHEVRFGIAVFDAARAADDAAPQLSITREGGETHVLTLTRGTFIFESEPWRAPSPGLYQLSASLRVPGREPIVARDTIRISEDPAADSIERERILCRALLEPESDGLAVRATLAGRDERPLLAILEDGEPLAAVPLDGIRGQVSTRLSTGRLDPFSARVVVAAAGESAIELVAMGEVAAASRAHGRLTVDAPTIVQCGGQIDVMLRGEDTSGAALAADVTIRLTDMRGKVFDLLWSAMSDEPYYIAPATSLAFVGPDGVQSVPEAQGRMISASVASLLFDGETRWLGGVTLAQGKGAVTIPCPSEAGRYQLTCIARTRDNQLHVTSSIIDARNTLRIIVDPPATMTTGDRSTVGVSLTNSSAGPIQFELTCDAGQPARLDSAEKIWSGTLAPGETRDLAVGLEAAEPGYGRIQAAIVQPTPLRTVAAPYEVRSAADVRGGAATGWLDAGRHVIEASTDVEWLPEADTRAYVQFSMFDTLTDAAISWLENPNETTAWQALRLDWAQAIMRLRPRASGRPVSELVAHLPLRGVGRRRLESSRRLTLAEFARAAARRLVAARHPDGGWSYGRDGLPAAIPTALAASALDRAASLFGDQPPDLRRSMIWLQRYLTSRIEGYASLDAADRRELLRSAVLIAPLAGRDALLEELWHKTIQGLVRDAKAFGRADQALLAFGCVRGAYGEAGKTLTLDARFTTLEHAAATQLAAALRASNPAEQRAALSELLAARDGLAWPTPLLTILAIRVLTDAGAIFPAAKSRVEMSIAPQGTNAGTVVVNSDARERWAALPAASRATLTLAGGGASVAWVGPLRKPRVTERAATIVERTIIRLASVRKPANTGDDARDGPNPRGDDSEQWYRRPWKPGDIISPGEQLLVRDLIDSPEPLCGVVWSQRIPPGFHAYRGADQLEDTVGALLQRRSDHISYAADKLSQDYHVHEWLMTAVRASAGVLPAPKMSAQGTHVPITVTPEKIMLVVGP